MSTPTKEQYESLIYADKEPDVEALSAAFDSCVMDLEQYFNACDMSYDDRRNIWPGKSSDLLKNAANAFPWSRASDQEVNVIGERIDYYVALMDQALQKSHIKAFPTNVGSMPRAGMVSAFIKWMRSTYIPDFRRQMELGANYLLEKGLMISYVGWKREQRTFLQTVTLEQINELSPDMAEMIVSGEDDDAIVASIMQSFPAISQKRANKAIRDLRKIGIAEISIPRATVDCPIVSACAPDGEVIFPAYVSDPQRAPYVFWRTFLTPQELEKKVTNEGWDAEWVESALENLRGKDHSYIEGERNTARGIGLLEDDSQLIMVIYGYQRLIDEEDGSEGIYCTVFHPDAEGYAKHELLNGYDDYPFIVTRLSNDQKRMYETQTFSDILRGAQRQIKTERDSRIDRASLATMPPLMHPAGRAPSEWGPGRRVPYKRLGEIQFGPQPPPDNGSIEVEIATIKQADRAVGLDMENPLSQYRQQFIINKFLDHVRDCLALAFKLYQRMGPDEVYFQVTGNPNPQTMTKGSAEDNYSIVVAFDSQSNDPETAETQLKNMISLVQFDRNGIVDVNKLLEFSAQAINPVLADYVLQPQEESQQKVMKNVTDDLAKIFSGIEVPAQPNGAQIALQLVQAYASQPDIAQRLQQDEAFAGRLQNYAGQYQFQMQQAQNAEIGKIGTAPAQMGGVQTQGMQQ